jgi:hypothetical protein
VLTLTSNPMRTSPVKRGKWVLENLLGVEPLPPPQNVPPLDQAHAEDMKLSLRQRMEKHRADPTCASCHAPMDPIGFALENFDAVGAFRSKDGPDKIDASAVLPDGSKFTGARELTALLVKTRRDDFLRAATEATLTFALGRGMEPIDQPAVDRIVDDLNKNNGRFSTLVMGVVNSVPFQMRRAESAVAVTDTNSKAVILSDGNPLRVQRKDLAAKTSQPDPSRSTAQDDTRPGGVR